MKIGRITGNAYRRSIVQQIRTKRNEVISGAGLGADCAVFSFKNADFSGENGCTDLISCMQTGEEAVDRLLQKCMNIFACHGVKAVAAALQILLPADAQEQALKDILAEAEQFAGLHDIQIAQVQGRVTQAVTEALVTVVLYGTGTSAESKSYHTVKAMEPGQDIVLSKWIGLEGTALLAGRERETLLERYPAWFIEEAAGFDRYLSIEPEAAVALKSGVCAMYHLAEGGILAALWELAEGAGVGLTIDIKKIPVRQETVEVCNQLNVNPYELLSGGCLLMTTRNGTGLAADLEAAGIPAAVIGRTTDSNDRLILNDGEERYLDRPAQDGIYTDIAIES